MIPYKVAIALAISIGILPMESSYANDSVDVFDFIQRYECGSWPTLHAYFDYKGYSIWCGTPSYKGEIITKEEAMKRFRWYVQKRIDLVQRDFPKAKWGQMVALVSLASNNGTCYKYFKKHWVNEYSWRNKCDKVKIHWKLKALRGLTIRRNHEADLYFSK